MTIRTMRFWLPMLALCVGPTLARAEVVELRTSQVCTFKISAVVVTDAVIIGHRESMLLFLQSRQVYVHACDWLLAPVKGMSETEYVMAKAAKAGSVPTDLGGNQVLVRLAHAEEFLAVFAASGSQPPNEPPGGAGPPAGKPAPAAIPVTPGSAEECKVEKICVKRDGHAEYEMKCGELDVEMSTDGAFGIGIKKGPFKLSVEAEGD